MSSTQVTTTVLIMAGGTGGHVFPALATAKELKARGCSVAWLGTEKGIEARLVPEQNIPLHFLSITGIRGKGLRTLLLAPWKILSSVIQARSILQELKPNVVLGMGGYASGPGAIAAKLLGIPLVIHEQNARPGTTNKWLSKVANKVLTGFPGVFAKASYIGNPVRTEILSLKEPNARMQDRSGPFRLLVLGGSLGARAINQMIPELLQLLDNSVAIEVRHQTGAKLFDETNQLYEQRNVCATVQPFIEDVAEALEWADLVICRSGALTIAELSIAGVASILIPFPFAIDDHQTANAQWLEGIGAAVIKQQSDLSAAKLKDILMELINNREKVLAMAMAAHQAALPNATVACADACLEVACG